MKPKHIKMTLVIPVILGILGIAIAALYLSFWGYFLAVNAFAYFVFGLDKSRAIEGKRRFSERSLLLWSLVGGALGGLVAMVFYRHKVSKFSFQLAFWGIVAIDAFLFWYFW